MVRCFTPKIIPLSSINGYTNFITGELDMPPLLPQEDDCNICKGKPNLIQRKDDTEEVVADRLRVYKESTEPILEFYRNTGTL